MDMSQSAKNIHNFIRGLDSSPGAFKRSSTSSPKHPYHHHHKQNQLHPRPRFLSRCLQTAPTSTLKPFWQNILTIIITSINILITNNIYHTQVPGQTSTVSQPSSSTVVSGTGSLNQVTQIYFLCKHLKRIIRSQRLLLFGFQTFRLMKCVCQEWRWRSRGPPDLEWSPRMGS